MTENYTYLAMFKGKTVTVTSDTIYHAQLEAAQLLGAAKTYQVVIMLAEKDGKPVVHIADF